MMGKCKLLNEWLEQKDDIGCRISTWGEKVSENELHCIPCDANISVAKGFCKIKQHYQTAKHKKNHSIKCSPYQMQLSKAEEKANVQLFCKKDASYSAELIWCLKIIASNMSANSSQDLTHVFKTMFQEGVPDKFSLNPTKVRYLISDALGPYFRNILLQELTGVYYTLCFDETTNNAGFKELQTAVRFWGVDGKVNTHHLETFFIGHAFAEDLKVNMLQSLQNAGLPVTKLLMISCDGPNVNKRVLNLMNEYAKEVRQKGLIDIGFCNIHLIHNAFEKGLEHHGGDASELIIAIYYYFKNWPSRWEDFSKILNEKNLPSLHFLKHVNSRWLTLQPAAERLLQLWDGVIAYFLTFIPTKQSKIMNTGSYERVVKYLKKKSMRAELHFICSSAAIFAKFALFFQKEEPLIHLMHEKIKEIVLTIMGRTCKPDVLKSFNTEICSDPFTQVNLLEIKDMPLSDDINIALLHATNSEKHQFVSNIQKHYISAGKYILDKKILQSNLLESFSFLKPSEMNKAKTIKRLSLAAHFLPLELDTEVLLDEWKMLQLEDLEHQENVRIDEYWGKISKLKTADGSAKYGNVFELAKAALTLAHGSAEIERGFSRSSRILTEDRACMSVRTLNARLNVVDGLKKYDNKVHLVPITEELLKLARMAYKSYNNYLEAEREKAENEKIKKFKAEQKQVEEEERRKKLDQSKETINALKKQLNDEKGKEEIQTSAVEQLLEEAHSKLRTALRKNDLSSAQVAETILEGAMKKNKVCSKKRKAISSLEKKIEKKTDSVMTNFFFKKPRAT